MPNKPPPRKDIERIRNELRRARSDGSQPESADLRWACRVLAGDDVAPPGDALRPEVAYALVDELVDERANEQLSRLAQDRHKTVCKAARTGIHRLRSHKVELELPVGDGVTHEGTGMAVEHALPSMVSVYDSGWRRYVWLGEDMPGGVRVFQGRVSAMYGLQDLQSGTTTRKWYRSKARQILRGLGGTLAAEGHARWFLHDAARRCEAAGRAQPRGFVLASQALGPDPGGEHPALELALAAGDPELPLELYELPELGCLQPDRDSLRRIKLQIDEAMTSRLVLSDALVHDRFQGIVERAAAAFFDATRCQACRTVLLDTAHIYGVRGDARHAAALRAAADVFAVPPGEVAANRFARQLISRAFERALLRRQRGDGVDPAPPALGGLCHDHAHDRGRGRGRGCADDTPSAGV
jgi:hypothetical protein